MSIIMKAEDEVIENKEQLISYMESGCKAAKQWRIGTEHEKFAFHLDSLSPLTYEGKSGIKELLYRLERFGWMVSPQNYFRGKNSQPIARRTH